MNPFLFRTLQRFKHLRSPEFYRTIRQVEQQQWMSRDELGAMAWKKQRVLVGHAYENCPFYKQKYDNAGFHPGDLKNQDDFASVPMVKKQEIRSNIENMVAKGIDSSRLRKKFTGGSTGVPLMIYRDAKTGLLMNALNVRTMGAWGFRQGCKIGHIWGLNPLNEDLLYTRQTWWKRFLKNYVLFNAYDMTPEKMTQFSAILTHFKPDLVISYTSAMTGFARYLEEHGGPRFSPKAIWLTSEPIHDFQKELVEQVFQSTVYNQYGSVEIFFLAAECSERDGLHINSDMRTLEVVDESGKSMAPGEMGRVVVSDLENHAAPLIRYQNEDMASLQANHCPCGRGLPLMSKVTGRIYDMFVLPDGSQIYGHRFTTFFYDHVDKVSNFQIHQTNKDRAVVRIVPTETCDRGIISTMVEKTFKEYTGGQMLFEIRFVDEIAKESSGKYRFAKSDVGNPSF